MCMGLKHWVEFFDDLQNVRGRSLNTIMAYRRDLETYVEYLSASPTGKRDIQGFYVYMTGKGLSTRSQARIISSLRTYFKFCETRGETSNELRELRPPKVKAGLPKAIGENDFFALYKACLSENPYKTARNQITLLLLFGLGCRVSELIGLNLHDFNESSATLTLLGKGNKERLVPLTEKLSRELHDYLEHIRPNLVKENTSSILINDRGNRPSRVDIWRWLAAWSEKAGFAEPIGPHQFRHGCATALLDSGLDLRSIQMLLGHASIQTTQIYTSVSQQKIVDTVEEHHPLSKI